MSIDNTFVFDFWILATVVCVKWCFVVVLICVSLVTDSVECLFMWLLALFISTLEKCVFISFAIFKLSYLSFYYWTERVFFFAIHILDIKAFIRYTNCQHFLPFCGLLFYSVSVFCTKYFSFDEVCVLLLSLLLLSYLRNLANSSVTRVSPFSFLSCIVLALMFGPFELIFVRG